MRINFEDEFHLTFSSLSFEDERFQEIVAKNKGKFDDRNTEKNITNEPSSPWYRCNYGDFVNYCDYIGMFYRTPFTNPLLYEDRFHELKGVDLYAFTGNNDFLLDHSIELARMWRGGRVSKVFKDPR